MASRELDCLVVGAGFAGSILAMVLHQAGLRVALVDRAKHPRFVIGESSTPAAAMILLSLAQRYDLPCLAPLAKYGTLRSQLPELQCGLKRGFSYFDHTRDGAWDASRQLLVAANPDAERGDLQWRRAAVDHYLLRQAKSLLPLAVDGVETQLQRSPGGSWTATIRPQNEKLDVHFVVDATGGADVTGLAGREDPPRLQTHTVASYGHVRGLRSWDELLPPTSRTRHPFCSDNSAQHHMLHDGWLWALRFDDGVTSVGRVYNNAQCKPPATFDEFRESFSRRPDLSAMLSTAQPVDRWRIAAPVQRQAKKIAGNDWALLPSAAGIIDPLHSTGIAHSLCGVESLAEALVASDRSTALQFYAGKLRRELTWIDSLVSAAYRTMADFRRFSAASMLYFAAATTFERRRLSGKAPWFLCADDEPLDAAVKAWAAQTESPHTEPEPLEQSLRDLLAPWNYVGLCDPAAGNMYRYEPDDF